MDVIKNILLQNRIISIVGMAKNSGKTVTLNHFIETAIDEGLRIGITSTGRDGEQVDLVSGTKKPRIYVEEGTVVAVPKLLYEFADAELEILRITEYHSSIGEILICKAVTAGYVQIAGPVSTAEQKKLCEEMLEIGVDLVLIDGAIDRKHIANPEISDAVILATGAALSRDMNKVVSETSFVVSQYNLPILVDSNVREILNDNIHHDKIVVIEEDDRKKILDLKTGLGASSSIDKAITENTKCIYIPGAFSASVVEYINRNKLNKIYFVLKDPTKIFMSNVEWLQYKKRGMKVSVLESINIKAITINPYSPNGGCFEPEIFKRAMEKIIKDTPIINVRG